MSFTQRILLSMLAGMIVGIALNMVGSAIPWASDFLVNGVFYVVGAVFVAMLKLMVVPLVLVSLVCGVNAMGDLRAIGRVGAKTFGLYFMTTAIAIILALTIARCFSPGSGFELTGGLAEYIPREAPSLAEVLINIFPENPIQAMADGQMLQIIVFALLFGFAANLAGERGKPIVKLFSDLNEVILKMVMMIILLAPVGVFALISRTFATEGIEVFGPLVGYFILVASVLILHLVFTYGLILKTIGIKPLRFLKHMRAPMSFAFSTSSSAATIPITLNTLKNRLGVKSSVSSFTVPLGATINMDGTAIMQGVATVFIANVYGINLMFTDYLMVVLTATLASIGTAAVPSAGLIMLAMVLGQVGLPVEGIALIIGVDRLLDMLRTAINVAGDSAVTCVVAHSEGALDLKACNEMEVKKSARDNSGSFE